ncbi:MAG: hypothetical protein IT167_10840 [Bryobacterales bacterium]|nr:hypothetical protein [Bryobacterales bacterium]
MDHSFTRRSLLTGAVAAFAGCSGRTKPFSGFAFVANEDGHVVAAVDLTAFALVRHVRLDAAPTELVSHDARQMVYALTPSTGTVHEISATKLRRERWTALGGFATHMRLSPRGDSLWVLLNNPLQLVEVRLETMEAQRRIPLPYEPVSFDLSLEEPRAVISFGAMSSCGLVDLESQRLKIIDSGSPLGAVSFRKDGRQWIAAHRQKRLLSIFDTVSSRVVVRLPLAMRPDNFCYKADRGQLFITGEGSDAVAIVFPFSTQVDQTVLAGRAPAAMAASPATPDSPEFLFVTNPQSNQVTIINIDSRKVVAVAQAGSEPTHVVITPNNQYALVLNRRSGDMAVILIQSTARRSKFPAALFTMIPVGSRPVSAVIQAV